MKLRRSWIAAGLVAAAAIAAAGGWIALLPVAPPPSMPPVISASEHDAMIAALKPPKRQRPVIAILGLNDSTELTDYLMPYGILRRADVADVEAIATGAGKVKLYPALSVEPQGTVIDFDLRHPEGADYVIVPAMSRDDDVAVTEFLKAQAEKGAIIVGVCAGAKVVASAGLLDNKRATTHWYYRNELQREHPSVKLVSDRRVVVDNGVATTTGISASMPMALTLIEAISGRDKAGEVARDLGVADWSSAHASSAFTFNRSFAVTALGNAVSLWKHETLGIQLKPGIDEVALALTADAWSRTYRSRAVTFSDSNEPQESANGLKIVPDDVTDAMPPEKTVIGVVGPPARALDKVLADIAERHGPRTADLVAMQLEYRRPEAR